MAEYGRVDIEGLSLLAAPVARPEGDAIPDADLARDNAWRGEPGIAYWPISYAAVPEIGVTRRLAGWAYEVHPTEPGIVASPQTEAMTAEEIAAAYAARHPVPASVTRRQLLLALARGGFITSEEAIAAAQIGAVPAAMAAIFDALPSEQALGARVTWATMLVAERNHHLVLAMTAAGLATEAQVDDLFRLAATL